MKIKKIITSIIVIFIFSLFIGLIAANESKTENRSGGASCHNRDAGVTTIDLNMTDNIQNSGGSLTVNPNDVFYIEVSVGGLGYDAGEIGFVFWHNSGDGMSNPSSVNTTKYPPYNDWTNVNLMWSALYDHWNPSTGAIHTETYYFSAPNSAGTYYL